MSPAYSDSFFQDCPDQDIDAMWAAYADSCRIEELESENAKLREDMEDLEGYDQMIRDRLRQVTELKVKSDSENSKLREFATDLWRFTKTACERYPRLFDPLAPGGQMVQLNAIESFEQRFHEVVGVGLDGDQV